MLLLLCRRVQSDSQVAPYFKSNIAGINLLNGGHWVKLVYPEFTQLKVRLSTNDGEQVRTSV